MNNLATEAIGNAAPSPLVTSRPVWRSSTAMLMSAPPDWALVVACWAMASRLTGSRGAGGACGAICGPDDSRVTPCGG